MSDSVPSATFPSDGLSFEVRECTEMCDDIMSPGSPVSPLQCEENHVLMRSQSAAETDPHPVVPESPPKDPNISRVQLGDNADTIDLLGFLTSQGVDTTKFVTEHVMKYGSFVRVAKTDEGKIIGCVIFDSETDQQELRDMSPDEAAKRVGPFIFQQLLIVAPEHVVDSSSHWKERLTESFMKCASINGKIAIIRARADNEKETKLFQSRGFLTMSDMGIPSYSSAKDGMEILAYTPMGLEGTAQIFKKFYEMGVRF
jgi:hypothetical protein